MLAETYATENFPYKNLELSKKSFVNYERLEQARKDFWQKQRPEMIERFEFLSSLFQNLEVQDFSVDSKVVKIGSNKSLNLSEKIDLQYALRAFIPGRKDLLSSLAKRLQLNGTPPSSGLRSKSH